MTEIEHKASITVAYHGAVAALAALKLAIYNAVQDGVTVATVQAWLAELGCSKATIDRRVREAFGRQRAERGDKGRIRAKSMQNAESLFDAIFAEMDEAPSGAAGNPPDNGGGGGVNGDETTPPGDAPKKREKRKWGERAKEFAAAIARHAVDTTKSPEAAEKKADELHTALGKLIKAALKKARK